MLAVGGTTLHKKSGAKPGLSAEVVWNDGQVGWHGRRGDQRRHSGSFWQVGIVPPSINPTHFQARGFSDARVVNADPNTGDLTYAGGQFGIVGGTSAAAPLWARSSRLQ